MKGLWKNGIIVLLIIAALYIIFIRECSYTGSHLKKGELIIKKIMWDSIVSIVNRPPVIHIDTIKIKTAPIIIKPGLPKPIVIKDSIYYYKDSLKNDEINVTIELKTKGTIVDRIWKYSPIMTQILKEKIIFVPKLVDNYIAIPKNGIYVYGGAGWNSDHFLITAGIDLITKKNTELGYFYQKFGNVGFHNIKIGIKLK